LIGRRKPLDISTSRPETNRLDGDRLPAGRREAFTLKALRDFTLCFARARDFDESLHLALMVILGTCSIVKGALFLEEDGEFRVRVSRGLPPGIPPIEASMKLLATLRRSIQPVRMARPAVSEAIRQAVADIERAVPARWRSSARSAPGTVPWASWPSARGSPGRR
jgi:hypothetical protein